ncbi:serine/threonine-protein kinase prp4-like isoform X2 [Prunus avium]|nr:serine/threonine-protein kinase prp4-like isoform X2 [Prunus avium]
MREHCSDDDTRIHVHGKSRDETGLPRHSSVEPQDDLASRLGIEDHANGDSHRFHKEEKRRHRESRLPSKESDKRKHYYDDEKVDDDRSKVANRKKTSSGSSGDKHKTLVCSSSHDRCGDDLHGRSRSRSYDHVRERSCSRSRVEEEALSKRRRYHERDTAVSLEKSKATFDSGDEGMVRRHDSDDLARDDERDQSISYSRYSVSDRTRERERSREREVDRIQRREKEQERSRNRVRRRDGERERSSDRDLVRDSRRGIGRDDSRERRREERHRSRDTENRDRKREEENDRSRDRVKADRDRDMERDRDRDRVTDRKWERRDDRDRGKGRDMEREKYENLEDSYGNRDRNKHSGRSRHDEEKYNQDRRRKTDPAKFQSSNNYAGEGVEDRPKRGEDEQEDNEERATLQFAEQEEEDLNRIKEESRRRRQAILEKYRNQQSQQTNELQKTESQLQQRIEPQALLEGVEKDKDPQVHATESAGVAKSGAETDDGRSDEDVSLAVFSISPQQNGDAASRMTSGATGLGEGTPKSERSDGIFCDDIFGETPVGVRKLGKGDGVRIERSGLHDNWDDAEGYYSYRFGELLDARYEIAAAHGKGVFSTVVRAKNLKVGNGEPDEVAIKIIRSNDTMYKAGMTELAILKKLVGQDPENKRHCVRFLSNFKYRNHLCLVFESLHMNLREVLKKFGRNIGLKLTAVRAYAKQLFIALKHLKNCGVLHCDIKPDNMLVNEAKNVLKLCDFGNAMFAGKNEVTPYLVSRFYRAPEIILGLSYDHPLDIWSVGCCLYELSTGKVLFPGATNNDMLRLHMELKGPFPKKMLRKGAFTHQHFDQDLNFHATEDDPVTKKTIKRVILNIKPKDIGSIITGSSGEDPKMLADFKDLLDKMFVLDPDKRLTVSQALSHPFITGK